MTKMGEFMSEVIETKPVEVSKGRIIKLHKEGWGFISSKDIPFTRVFFHWTSLRQDTKNFLELKVGDNVEFIPAQSEDKGTRAIKIKVIETTEKVE